MHLGLNATSRSTIFSAYVLKSPCCEYIKNTIYQYILILGVDFTLPGYKHDGKKTAIDKIRHKNHNCDVKRGEIYFACIWQIRPSWRHITQAANQRYYHLLLLINNSPLHQCKSCTDGAATAPPNQCVVSYSVLVFSQTVYAEILSMDTISLG